MEITGQFMVLVPVVIGVVQALKKLGLSTKVLPILSMLLGVAFVSLLSDFSLSGQIILEGVVIGLTASGLYTGVKKTIE